MSGFLRKLGKIKYINILKFPKAFPKARIYLSMIG